MARRSDYYTYNRPSVEDVQFRRAAKSPAPIAFDGVSDDGVQSALSALSRSLGGTIDRLGERADREAEAQARRAAQAQAETDKSRRDISKAEADTAAAEAFADLEVKSGTDVDAFKAGARSISDNLVAGVTDGREIADRRTVFERRYRESLLRVKNAKADADKRQTAADYLGVQKKNAEDAALAIRNGDYDKAKELNKAAVAVEDMMILKGMATPVERTRMIEDRQYNAELAGHYRNIDWLKPQGVGEMQKYVRRVVEDESIPTQKRLRFAAALQQECDRYRAEFQAGNSRRNEKIAALERSIEAGYETDDAEVLEAQNDALRSGDEENYEKLAIVREVAKIANVVRTLPPDEQDGIIARAVVRPDTAVFDEKLNKSLRKIRDATVAGLLSDPTGVPVRAGLLAPLDDFRPETVKARADGLKEVEARYGRKFPLFAKAEAERLALTVGSFETYADRARALGMVMQAVPDYADDVLSAVAPKNPEIAHAAQIADLGDDDTAQKIMQGADVVRETPEYAPAINTAFKNALANKMTPDVTQAMSPEFESGVKAAVVDYYAAVMRSRGDAAKVLDESLLNEAVDKVTGGVVEYGGGWFGGKKKTIAPARGMTSKQFENLIDNLAPEDFDGALLEGNRFVADRNVIEDAMSFVAIGRNKYRVVVGGRDLMDKSGQKQYVFSFPDWLSDRVAAGEAVPAGEVGTFGVEKNEDGHFVVKFAGENGETLDAGTFKNAESAERFAAAARSRHAVPETVVAKK